MDFSHLPQITSYLIRAFHEWCEDNSFSTIIIVSTTKNPDEVQVPQQYVHEGRIAFDISSEACDKLSLGDEYITLDARFDGKVEHLIFPVENVLSIFTEECEFGLPLETLPHNRKKAEPKKVDRPVFSEV